MKAELFYGDLALSSAPLEVTQKDAGWFVEHPAPIPVGTRLRLLLKDQETQEIPARVEQVNEGVGRGMLLIKDESPVERPAEVKEQKEGKKKKKR